MRLLEIIDYVILETGNYLVDTLIRQDIDIRKFSIMLKSVIAEYSNYRPLHKNLVIYVDSNPYEFLGSVAPNSIDKMNYGLGVSPGTLKTDPFRILTREHRPALAPWRYEKPLLYTTYTGVVEIGGCFDYFVQELYDSNGELVDYSIPDISYSDVEFLQLMKAKFLMIVGRQRRAFTANDLPLTTDASDLISEGNDLWTSTKEQLAANGKWWCAI